MPPPLRQTHDNLPTNRRKINPSATTLATRSWHCPACERVSPRTPQRSAPLPSKWWEAIALSVCKARKHPKTFRHVMSQISTEYDTQRKNRLVSRTLSRKLLKLRLFTPNMTRAFQANCHVLDPVIRHVDRREHHDSLECGVWGAVSPHEHCPCTVAWTCLSPVPQSHFSKLI